MKRTLDCWYRHDNGRKVFVTPEGQHFYMLSGGCGNHTLSDTGPEYETIPEYLKEDWTDQ